MIYLMMLHSEDDKETFRFLYEKYRYSMYKIAYDILQDEYLAEDAVHEAFIRIAGYVHKMKDTGSYATRRLIIQIVKTASIDIYRQHYKINKSEVYVNEIGERIEPVVKVREENINGDLLKILIQVPPKYRDVMILKFSHEYSNKEIADLLGITEINVRQRIKRGKEYVRKEIEKRGGLDEEDGNYR